MINLLRARYFWPGLSTDVVTHARECHECTLGKPLPKPLAAPSGTTVGAYPFDVVYCDILSMAKTHDFVAGVKGYDRLIVFVDSLSRWIEAEPCNGDPTSDHLVTVFMRLIVSRHGVPRQLRTDAGTNLCSRLVATILSLTGTDLSSTEAYRHEGVGLVERAQQTLVTYTRVSDEGGRYWADHLPYMLMSMRATAGRIVPKSPAVLLYGRELRLPAQLAEPTLPREGEPTLRPSIAQYADSQTRLLL